jgi:hypothetical protein
VLPPATGHGDPGGSRTPNPQIRSLMLYPVELRGRFDQFNTQVASQQHQSDPLVAAAKVGIGQRFWNMFEEFLAVGIEL